MAFELTGTIRHIFDTQTFASGFSKREFVIEVEDGKFPQMIKFECVKDRTAMLDDVSPGDQVQVAFDIRGNEYKERYYVNLNAWKLTKTDGSSSGESQGRPAASPPSSQRANSSLDASFDNEPDESDDIPF